MVVRAGCSAEHLKALPWSVLLICRAMVDTTFPAGLIVLWAVNSSLSPRYHFSWGGGLPPTPRHWIRCSSPSGALMAPRIDSLEVPLRSWTDLGGSKNIKIIIFFECIKIHFYFSLQKWVTKTFKSISIKFDYWTRFCTLVYWGRRHWVVYFTSPKSFIVTFSYSLVQ